MEYDDNLITKFQPQIRDYKTSKEANRLHGLIIFYRKYNQSKCSELQGRRDQRCDIVKRVLYRRYEQGCLKPQADRLYLPGVNPIEVGQREYFYASPSVDSLLYSLQPRLLLADNHRRITVPSNGNYHLRK